MLFKVGITVRLSLRTRNRIKTQSVELDMEEPFTQSQLPTVGSALQRGVYSALEAAMKELMLGEEPPAKEALIQNFLESPESKS